MMPELTPRCILLAIVLTVILAVSNAYLALKLGMLTSASIPAAILSMGILRLFKKASILENNAVQTAASAGEAVAGGIVYTIPALIIVQYWHHFDYWTNFFIALSGGVLGVLFSIPLRRMLVHDRALRFPEGMAIAEVLKSSHEKIGFHDILLGGLIGGLLELFQVGFKVIASSWTHWFVVKRTLFGFGAGFSATMIGAGYLIGRDMALSIFIGACLSWLFAVPVASHFFPTFIDHHTPEAAVTLLWSSELRYLGIGAMLFAGIWTFARLARPLMRRIGGSLSERQRLHTRYVPDRLEQDLPMSVTLIGIGLMAIGLFFFFQYIFPLSQIGIEGLMQPVMVFAAIGYILLIGFLFSVMTAYFSGMVGVTASPGSSVVIAGILFAGWGLLAVLRGVLPLPLTQEQISAAEVIVIIIGSIVTGIAAIANDNTQDLKVGQLVGATPWRQQLMLLLGVLVSSLVIPPVMQLLFDVYGIAGVMPRAGMDVSQSLPAPTAVLLAAITDGVFQHSLPWTMMMLGAGIILLLVGCARLFGVDRGIKLSILGVGIGLYLPLSSSIPLFIGGCIAWRVERRLAMAAVESKQVGTRIACGLVAGSALMDVLLAIPFSIQHSPDAWRLVGDEWSGYGLGLAILSTIGLFYWIKQRVQRHV